MIYNFSVNFLRHRLIKTTQARLNMDYRNTMIGSDQGAGNRRVHIPHHQQGMGPDLLDNRIKPFDYFTDLFGMGAGPHPKIIFGLRSKKIRLMCSS